MKRAMAVNLVETSAMKRGTRAGKRQIRRREISRLMNGKKARSSVGCCMLLWSWATWRCSFTRFVDLTRATEHHRCTLIGFSRPWHSREFGPARFTRVFFLPSSPPAPPLTPGVGYAERGEQTTSSTAALAGGGRSGLEIAAVAPAPGFAAPGEVSFWHRNRCVAWPRRGDCSFDARRKHASLPSLLLVYPLDGLILCHLCRGLQRHGFSKCAPPTICQR